MTSPKRALLDTEDYREFLARYLEDARTLNPRFGLRAFSRQVGLAPSTLSSILNGRRRASPRLLTGIAEKIKLPSGEREHFRILIRLETVAHASDRRNLIGKIARNRLKKRAWEVPERDLPALMSWEVFKLNEILASEAGWVEKARIAERAGIPAERAESIFDLLESRAFVQRDAEGRLRRRPHLLLGASAGTNESLRHLHREGLARAHEAVNGLNPDSRYSSTEMFSLTDEDFATARRLTEAYLDRLQLLHERNTDGIRRVWAVSLHLFRAEGGPL